MDRSAGGWIGAWMMAAGVVLLLLVVAAAATEVPGDEPLTSLLVIDSEAVADIVVPLLRLGYLVILIAALYRWLYSHEPRRRSSGPRRRLSPLTTFAALVILALGVYVFSLRGPDQAVSPTSSTMAPSPAEDPPPPGEAVAPLGERGWGVLIATAVGLAALVYLVAARRRDIGVTPGVTNPGPQAAWGREMVSLDPSDPAARVFAAYRRVEDASQRVGVGRAVTETVGSHLGRVGGVAGVEPAGVLADAYHHARFSAHPVSPRAAAEAEAQASSLERRLVE